MGGYSSPLKAVHIGNVTRVS